jgi:hypothetical protein
MSKNTLKKVFLEPPDPPNKTAKIIQASKKVTSVY